MELAMFPTFTDWLEHAYVPIAGAEAQEQTTQAAPEGDAGDAGAEGGAPDYSALTDRMDEVLNRVGGIEERWTAAEQAAYAQHQQQQDPYAQQQAPEDELGQYGQPGFDADLTDPELAQQLIRAEVERGVQAQLGPVLEQQAQQRRVDESNVLIEDYPELGEPQAAQGLISDAQQWASDITRDLSRSNPQLAQALVQEPAYLELVHLAAKAAAAAENEATPAQSGDAPVELEGGAPSNPGGGESSQPLGEQIKQAGSRNTFWTG
jgi:hypothetical protein